MLRGYRLFFVALGLVLAAHHPNLEAQPKQGAPAERSADALESIAATYDKQAKGAERSPESNPCKPGDDQRNSDLCAQWKAADAAADSAWWASWGTWISGISGALVIVAIGLAFQSNQIARAAAHNQLRAYVTIGGVEMQFRTTDAGDKRWHIDVALENNGQTPAFLQNFSIDIGWRRKGVAADIIDSVYSAFRDTQVVIASGKPFSIFVEIGRSEFSLAPLLDGDKLTIRGKVAYLDIYGESRTSTYRLYVDSKGWEKGSGIARIGTSMTGNTCT